MFDSTAFISGVGQTITGAVEESVFEQAKDDGRLQAIRSHFVDLFIQNKMKVPDFEQNIWLPFLLGNKDPITRLGFLPKALRESGNRRLITKFTQVVFYLTFKRRLMTIPEVYDKVA